jgi:D-lactate dehydrogenase
MKIAFFEIEAWEKSYLEKNLKGNKLYFSEKELDEKTARKVKDFDVVSVFINSDVNARVLNQFRKLKSIVTRSTGFDHIHLKACNEKGIKIFNVPHYGENTVAEHTFGLILALSKRITDGWERVKKGDFSHDGLQGFDLKDKTIGIVGMGRIGSHVAKIANGFEMKVLAYNPRRNPYFEKRFNFKYVSLEYLLKNSDIITLHCPYNKQTHHLINSSTMKMIKKGAYLINTARGGLVDTEILIKMLKKGIIAGVGLDVLEEEDLMDEEKRDLTKSEKSSLMENHELLKLKNVVITPHNAFNTKEAIQRILDTTIENIKAISEGRSIKENLVE